MADPEETPYADVVTADDEVATLLSTLERIRRTFAWKCGGLDAEGLRATTAASAMTLGGLLKHLALQPGRFTWPDGRTPNLRRIVADVIEEYARHTGHADLLREAAATQPPEASDVSSRRSPVAPSVSSSQPSGSATCRRGLP